jgi:hypothetical protein
MPTAVTCPDCARTAVVLGRFVLPSAAGPVEYLRIRCGDSLSLIVAAAAVDHRPSAPVDRARGAGG